MGFSSEQQIAESNRNEAMEAITLLEGAKKNMSGMLFDNEVADIEHAIELIKKFADKHQPEIQRYK